MMNPNSANPRPDNIKKPAASSDVRLVQNIIRHRKRYFVTASFKRVDGRKREKGRA